MKRNQTDRKLLSISVGCFFLMSVSFLLMPVKTMKIIPGLLFWGGLAGGAVLQILLAVRRRAFLARNSGDEKKSQKSRIGLLTFGSSPAAMLADKVLAGSVVAVTLAFIVTKGTGYLCFVFIATTVFSFCLHCILNGRICFHVNNQSKIRQTPEQKKAKISGKGEGKK